MRGDEKGERNNEREEKRRVKGTTNERRREG
jgi:hypothetical protein